MLEEFQQGHVEWAVRGEQMVVDPEALANGPGLGQVAVQHVLVAFLGGRRIDV
jgi:hypothetical protein